MPIASASSHNFRARAFNKASKLWTQSSDYLAPALDSAARGIQDLRERREWDTPDGILTTPKGILARGRQGSMDSFASTVDERSLPNVIQAAAGSRWGGIGAITGYFASGAREKRDQNYYSEEKIVCFPGVGFCVDGRREDGMANDLCVCTVRHAPPVRARRD